MNSIAVDAARLTFAAAKMYPPNYQEFLIIRRINALEMEWLALKNEVEGQLAQMKLQLEIADKSKPEDAPGPKVSPASSIQNLGMPF